MSWEKVPPVLPGEVWRGVETEDGEEIVIAVAPVGGVLSPRFWYPSHTTTPGRWMGPGHAFGERILVAWALHQRAVGAAERALREAVCKGYEGPCSDHIDTPEAGCFQCETDTAVNTAAAALRALGVEP